MDKYSVHRNCCTYKVVAPGGEVIFKTISKHAALDLAHSLNRSRKDRLEAEVNSGMAWPIVVDSPIAP